MEIKKQKYNFDSERQDYMTPRPEIIQPLLDFEGMGGFDIDVCCTTFNIPAVTYFTENGVHTLFGFQKIDELNGLENNWWGRCWMNPPFNIADKFVKKAIEEVNKNDCKVWSIIPARTETKYWGEYILNNPDCFVVFLRKGLCFIHPDTHQKMPPYKNPLAIVYFGKDAKEVLRKWIQNPPIAGNLSINPAWFTQKELSEFEQLKLAV